MSLVRSTKILNVHFVHFLWVIFPIQNYKKLTYKIHILHMNSRTP
nr:MAG TPA: hypothetical protein [Bacteriophage sp.]